MPEDGFATMEENGKGRRDTHICTYGQGDWNERDDQKNHMDSPEKRQQHALLFSGDDGLQLT